MRFLPFFLFTFSLSAQDLWENPVRKLLKEGKPVIAGTVTIPSVDVAAQMANMGFDLIWIEMEHSPITLETARNMILATRGLKAMPFIRVPVNELWTAKRALDMGAIGVIFPFTSTPELAKQAAAATKYPPEGRRGFAAGLPSFRWPSPEGYPAFANRNVMTIVIVEEERALANLDAIASTPGIDVLFIGTNDLAQSLGVGGQMDHPKMKAALDKILAAGKKHGLPVGRPAGSPELIKRYLAEGYQFIQGPSDLVMLGGGAKPLLDALGKSGINPKDRPLY
ncbi:MAG: aldolase [Acidobacteria bacterium]|nr:aldolase [Acidobacteriota bacterium]